jgi:hypothetical protein
MRAAADQQISLTDPDSRSMATSGRGSGVVGYNVQVAVDTEHHLIGTVNLSGRSNRRQMTGDVHQEFHWQPMLQMSVQTRNVWVLEALCSAAVM